MSASQGITASSIHHVTVAKKMSVSADGTMKLFDLRDDKSEARITFLGKSEAVRDVQTIR